jgi:hypothetical protein
MFLLKFGHMDRPQATAILSRSFLPHVGFASLRLPLLQLPRPCFAKLQHMPVG